jgi:hypothetical protein
VLKLFLGQDTSPNPIVGRPADAAISPPFR